MERLWELDAARGTALVLMLAFNWSKTLDIFGIYTVSGGWFYQYFLPRMIAFMFIFIAGVSLTLSINRFKKENPDSWRNKAVWKYLKRGTYIFGIGMLITLVTYVLFPDMFVFFGILHLIGASIALSYPLINRPRAAGIIGLLIIAFSPLLSSFQELGRLGAAIGLSSTGIATLDFFPLVPWSGVVFLGIAVGHFLFPDGDRRYRVPESFSLGFADALRRFMALIGRYTLPVYLLHQPVLVLVLLILGFSIF